MAEINPYLVRSLVISGSVIAMTDSISDATLERLGMRTSAELLLPETVKGLKALQSLAMYKKIWFPDFLIKDYIEVNLLVLLLLIKDYLKLLNFTGADTVHLCCLSSFNDYSFVFIINEDHFCVRVILFF